MSLSASPLIPEEAATVVEHSSAESADLAGGPQDSARRAVYLAFVAMPLTFVDNAFGGFRLSGYAWLLILATITPLVLTGPLPIRAVRYLLPYLAFLGLCLLSLAWVQELQRGVLTTLQLAVPMLAYIVAWRISDSTVEVQDRLAQICMLELGLVVAWLVADRVLGGLAGLRLAVRPVAISLTVLFLVATINTRSWRRTMLVGLAVLLVAGLTGSRTSAAILLILLLCSPSLGLSSKWRATMVVLVILLLVGVTQTEAFKARFFFNSDATLVDVLTFSPNLNTAGRREFWPELIETCSNAPVTGLGVGASFTLMEQITNGALNQPHNDYLRIYCETGWPGSIAFWGFFLAAGMRSVKLAVRGTKRQLHVAAGLLVVAFILFALTDNPAVYTAHFMTPLAVILGLSDGTYHRERFHRISHGATTAPYQSRDVFESAVDEYDRGTS
jgi:O-antigen ligase